jgi:hypothetical protein
VPALAKHRQRLRPSTGPVNSDFPGKLLFRST